MAYKLIKLYKNLRIIDFIREGWYLRLEREKSTVVGVVPLVVRWILFTIFWFEDVSICFGTEVGTWKRGREIK